jgi:7-alpha-hydroxysteroid dehydrogenase
MTILDRFRLDGRTAIVTGAGRGIGAGAAVALAEAGADVLISARTEDNLKEVAARIEATGRRAVVVPANLFDLEAVAGLADVAQSEFGRIDIVVNNVGGTIPNTFLATDAKYLEDAFRFNVTTAHELTRAAVPHMLKGDGGAVVHIASTMSRLSGRGYLAYGTAKAALAHHARLAAADLAPHIRVNAIAVGATQTSALDFVTADANTKAQMEADTPLKRLGDVEDIAATIVWLTSQAGSYVTGKLIEVDGGIDQPNLDLNLPDLEKEQA